MSFQSSIRSTLLVPRSEYGFDGGATCKVGIDLTLREHHKILRQQPISWINKEDPCDSSPSAAPHVCVACVGVLKYLSDGDSNTLGTHLYLDHALSEGGDSHRENETDGADADAETSGDGVSVTRAFTSISGRDRNCLLQVPRTLQESPIMRMIFSSPLFGVERTRQAWGTVTSFYPPAVFLTIPLEDFAIPVFLQFPALFCSMYPAGTRQSCT